ncbi:MAG TPA: chromosomal replication initiator protein DnaA [Polyangiaceae bacterium]|jgi:chromosomal replication initiator protein
MQTKDGNEAVFESAVAFTRERSPASFDQWFSGVQFDGLVDGVLSLRARDEFVREWVGDHFLPALTDSIRAQTGWSVQVAWTIDEGLSSPVADQPSSPPIRPRALSLRPSSIPPAPSERSSELETHLERPSGVHTIVETSAPAVAPISPASPASPVSRVAPPIEGLNPKYTFASFVVGPSNQLAHAASIAAAGGGGRRHNPLFICGGTGLGKTHLVHGVAHRVRAERPGARIVYISAERFVNEFVQAIQDQKMGEFRARYRERCDLLLVDDIQFLASKTQTQEEFFHAFNALHQADKQIIVTSDKYPQQLERMEERLISRFTWGLVADIQAPELETRVAILRKKAQIEHIELRDDVVLYLAQTVRSNVRELEGTLIRLAAKSSLLGRVIDLEFAKQEIASAGAGRASETSVEDIQRVVCHYFKLRSTDLLSKDRHKSVAFARHVAMYLCKQRLKCSFPELGRAFGNRDHTTVMSAVRKIESLRTESAEVRADLEAIERKLGSVD